MGQVPKSTLKPFADPVRGNSFVIEILWGFIITMKPAKMHSTANQASLINHLIDSIENTWPAAPPGFPLPGQKR